MEKNSKDQLLRKIQHHNRNIPKTIFQSKPQQFLVKQQTFGISNQNIFGQFSMINKDSLLYYCSSMLVIKSIDKNTSTFLYREGKLKNVTAICSTIKEQDEKETIIVAGESSGGDNQKATISIITLSSDEKEDWKMLQTSHKGRIQYLEINPSKTRIGCLIVTPEQTHFNLFNIEKYTLLVCSTFKSNDIKRFTLDLNSQKLMYIYGDGLLKLHQFNTTQRCLKDLGVNLLAKQNKQTKFIDHLWIHNGNHKQPNTLILLSNTKVYIIKNENIIRVVNVDIEKTKIKSWQTLKLDYTKDVEEERPIVEPQQIRLTEKFQLKCMMRDHRYKRVHDDSIILGASNGLLIILDIQSTEMNIYQILSNEEMIYLSSSPSRNIIASVSRDYYQQNLCFNLTRPQMLDSDDFPSKSIFNEGCHWSSILSLSLSCSREIFATVSNDKSVRVWNYNTKQSIIYGNYKQTPICIAIHPSGFYLAMAFSNQIQMYSILSNSLYLLKSIRNLEQIKSIKFSHKGDFLIANQTSCLKLYDPYNFRVISIYEIDDGRVPILEYTLDADDLRLVAVYQNGNVYCWNIVEGENELPLYPAHVEPLGYKHMVFDSGMFVGSNETKYISLYKDDCKTLVNEFPVVDCTVTNMLLSKQLSVLIVGTSIGVVRLYSWPINQNLCPYQIIQNSLNKVRLILPSCYQLAVHNSNITCLGISEDCRYLFSGLDNGGVMMMEIKGLKTEEERNQKNKDLLMETKEERRKIKELTTNLVLICETKIRDKNDQLTRMEAELERMEEQIEKEKVGREKHLKRMEEEKIELYSNIIVKDKETQAKTILTQKNEINKLQYDYETTKALFDETVSHNLENHERAKEYQKNRREKVRQEVKDIKRQHIKRLDELLSTHRVRLNEIKDKYKSEGQGIQKEYKDVLTEGKQKFHLQIVDMQQQQVSTNKQKLEYLNKVIEDLREEYKQLEQNCIKNKGQDEQLQIKFNQALSNQNNCRLKNIKSREEILKMQHQLNERIGIIRHKEESYKEATEDQMNLQNYKSLIDDRIIGLQQNKKSMIEVISEKDEELETLFNELIGATEKNDKKEFEIDKLEGYKEHLEGNAKRSEIQIFFGMKRLKSYQEFIENILNSKMTRNKIYAKICDFLSKPLQEDLQMIGYLQKLKLTNKDMKEIAKLKEEKGNQENNILQSEGKVITKKFNLMKFTCKKMKDIHETNITYTLKQNQKLLEQCNLLRYQNECYEKEIRKIEKFINFTIQERRKLAVRRKSGEKMMLMENKLKANELSLKEQAFKLEEIREFISNFKDDKDDIEGV